MKVKCKTIEHVSHSTECKVDEYCCKKMKKAMKPCGSKYSHGIFKLDRCGIYFYYHASGGDYCFDGCGHHEGRDSGRMYLVYCPFCGEMVE